jgi:hypothetical protein
VISSARNQDGHAWFLFSGGPPQSPPHRECGPFKALARTPGLFHVGRTTQRNISELLSLAGPVQRLPLVQRSHPLGRAHSYCDEELPRSGVPWTFLTMLSTRSRVDPISLCVSPVRDELGTIIGASKIARDITQRKQIERQVAILARKAEHRTRNILATVSATVELSQSDTPEGLKAAICGRIQAWRKSRK